MANQYVKHAFMGYTKANSPDDIVWVNSFIEHKGVGLIVVVCTDEIERAIATKIEQNQNLRISPFLKTFGLGRILQAKKAELMQKFNEYKKGKSEKIQSEIEQTSYLKLYIQFLSEDDEGSPEIYSFVRNEAYVKIENNLIADSVETKEDDDKDPFMIPPKESFFDLNFPQEGKGALSTSIDLLGKIALAAGVSQETVNSSTQWLKDNPTLSVVLATTVLPRVLDFVTGKPTDLSFSGLGIDAAKGAAIGLFLTHFLGDKAPAIDGATAAASGGGGTGLFGGLFSSYSGGGRLEFDDGAARDEETAQLQRCLIRFAQGNLAAERMNLQPPKYDPIVGIKISGKKNYADDGRFGTWTLNATTKYYKQINSQNADDIKKDPSVEIKDPRKIPLKVLYSTACEGKTDANPTQDETKQAEALMSKTESKIYKDFPFLYSKKKKLHATLMEQLRKNLKRT